MRDNLMRRVWFCAHPDVVQTRNDLVGAEMLAKARAEFLDPFWTTGIFLHPTEDPRYTPPKVSEGIELRDASGNLVEDISEVLFSIPSGGFRWFAQAHREHRLGQSCLGSCVCRRAHESTVHS